MAGGTPKGTAWSVFLYCFSLTAALAAAVLLYGFMGQADHLLDTAQMPPDVLRFPLFEAGGGGLIVAAAAYIAATRLRTPPRLVLLLFPPLAGAVGFVWLLAGNMSEAIANIGVLDYDGTLGLALSLAVFAPPAALVWLFALGKYTTGIPAGRLRTGYGHLLLWLLCALNLVFLAGMAWQMTADSSLGAAGGIALSAAWLYHTWCLLVGRAWYFAEKAGPRVDHFAPVL